MTLNNDLASFEERIAAFPWPFSAEVFKYSTNVEPAHSVVQTAAGAWGSHITHIDPYYREDVALRERILATDASRHAVLPHMVPATWDAMMFLMRELAASYPQDMELNQEPDGSWSWRNRILNVVQNFRYGDATTLPEEPLKFIGKQLQEDIVLLEEREDTLWADAGLVTFAMGWSFNFVVGMSFAQLHTPVIPRVQDAGILSRAEKFLLRMQPGNPYRRTSWMMMVDRRLDASAETYPEWDHDSRTMSMAEVGRRLQLRVEVQHLTRLPDSGCIMFTIHTHMLPLEDVARVPAWAANLLSVLEEVPEDVADYKGVTPHREVAVKWLRNAVASVPRQFDDTQA